MPWITNSLTSIVLSPLVGCLVGSSHVLLGSGSDYGCVEYKWGYMRWSYICFAFSVGRSWTSVNHWKFPTTTNKIYRCWWRHQRIEVDGAPCLGGLIWLDFCELVIHFMKSQNRSWSLKIEASPKCSFPQLSWCTFLHSSFCMSG